MLKLLDKMMFIKVISFPPIIEFESDFERKYCTRPFGFCTKSKSFYFDDLFQGDFSRGFYDVPKVKIQEMKLKGVKEYAWTCVKCGKTNYEIIN